MSPSRSITRNRLSLVSGASSQSSPVGLIGAILLHGAIILATLFSWEHRLDIAQESPPIVPVDLVTIAQRTNIAPTVERKIEPEKIEEQQHPDITPQTPPLPQPVPEQKSELAPQPQAKPVPKPQPPKKTDLEKAADFMKQLASATPHPQQQNARSSTVTHKGIGAQNANTMDLRDALKNAIEQCWSPPAGAPHPEQLIVSFHLDLNPDGSVAGSPQLTAESAAAAAANPFMRAAAEAARRAIFVCAPYKLPADRFADWRDSVVQFDPRDLAGQ